MLKKNELVVEHSNETLVYPKLSYGTLAYVIRLSGAKKLLDGEPLSKMIPVGDYIPIKFGQHAE